jgi:hypothetical protein
VQCRRAGISAAPWAGSARPGRGPRDAPWGGHPPNAAGHRTRWSALLPTPVPTPTPTPTPLLTRVPTPVRRGPDPRGISGRGRRRGRRRRRRRGRRGRGRGRGRGRSRGRDRRHRRWCGRRGRRLRRGRHARRCRRRRGRGRHRRDGRRRRRRGGGRRAARHPFALHHHLGRRVRGSTVQQRDRRARAGREQDHHRRTRRPAPAAAPPTRPLVLLPGARSARGPGRAGGLGRVGNVTRGRRHHRDLGGVGIVGCDRFDAGTRPLRRRVRIGTEERVRQVVGRFGCGRERRNRRRFAEERLVQRLQLVVAVVATVALHHVSTALRPSMLGDRWTHRPGRIGWSPPHRGPRRSPRATRRARGAGVVVGHGGASSGAHGRSVSKARDPNRGPAHPFPARRSPARRALAHFGCA